MSYGAGWQRMKVRLKCLECERAAKVGIPCVGCGGAGYWEHEQWTKEDQMEHMSKVGKARAGAVQRERLKTMKMMKPICRGDA